MEFLKNLKDFFKDLRLDTALNEMLRDAREFADEIDIPANFELTQPRHRVRRRNVNFDYEAREDSIEDTPQNDELKYCKNLETVLTDGNSSDINVLDLEDEIVAV
ncbi:uncharacterized protein TNCV_4688481 [Trichonephila clavipes]|nr:uncharacterized protein TNCV_4688481 [Trichonephila clavipes]